MADHTLSLQTRNRTFHPVLSLSFGHPTKPIPGEWRSYYSALTDDGEEKQSPSCRPDHLDLHTYGTVPRPVQRPSRGLSMERPPSALPPFLLQTTLSLALFRTYHYSQFIFF
jgi:hypothetical protein